MTTDSICLQEFQNIANSCTDEKELEELIITCKYDESRFVREKVKPVYEKALRNLITKQEELDYWEQHYG